MEFLIKIDIILVMKSTLNAIIFEKRLFVASLILSAVSIALGIFLLGDALSQLNVTTQEFLQLEKSKQQLDATEYDQRQKEIQNENNQVQLKLKFALPFAILGMILFSTIIILRFFLQRHKRVSG